MRKTCQRHRWCRNRIEPPLSFLGGSRLQQNRRNLPVSSEVSSKRPLAANTLTTQPVAMITGGAPGVGLAQAQLLAKRRFRVLLADVDQARIQQAATGFAAGALFETTRFGVTDGVAVEAAVTQVAALHGSLDYLFNKAGIGSRLDVSQATLAHWQCIAGLNLTGVVCPGPVRSAIWGTPTFGERTAAKAPAESITAEKAAATIWRG